MVSVFEFRVTAPPLPAREANVALTPVPRLKLPPFTVTFGDEPSAVALFRLSVPDDTTAAVPADKPGDAVGRVRVPAPPLVSVRTVPPSLRAPVVTLRPAAGLIV